MSAHDPSLPAASVHDTALIEDGVTLGPGTTVWDHVHIRRGARIGARCIVGEKSYIAGDVVVGDLCKLNAAVYLCAGVTLHRGVMIAAHTVFTNDLFPRATDPELRELRPSAPDQHTLSTTVHEGATIGANCTIGPGLQLGAFCMIGMGSVVTRDVPAHALVLGNPARLVGLVCACGSRVAAAVDGAIPGGTHGCSCGRSVTWNIDAGSAQG